MSHDADDLQAADALRRQQEQQAREREVQRLRDAQAQRDRDFDLQLIEDEERERLQAGAQARPSPDEAEVAAPRRKSFLAALGLGRGPGKADADQDGDDVDTMPEPQATSEGGSTIFWLIGLLVLVLGGGFLGYRFMGARTQETPPVAAAPKSGSVDLPVAAAGAGLSDPQGPGHSKSAESSAPAATPAAPTASATPSALADPVDSGKPLVRPETSDGTAPAGATHSGAAAAGADKPITVAEAAELRERIGLSEIRLTNLQAAFEREVEARMFGVPRAAANASAAAAPAPASDTANARSRSTKTAPTRKASPASAPTPAKPALQAELLSVDVWDGKPSIVVGTDAPGDIRSRVLQIGDQVNGITLQSVDVAARRATFSTGSGTVTLDMIEGPRP